MMKTLSIALIFTAATLSGCGLVDRLKPKPSPIVAPVEQPAALPALGTGQAAAALDTSTTAEKAAALAAPSGGGERDLGTTTVALGSPAEQGFWLKSALVAGPGKGRVKTASGASVAVDLIPGQGGSFLSLAAYRALGLSLTDLPEVTVYAN
jgi:hypothetical protein